MKAPVHPKYCKQQRGYRGVDEVLYAGVDAHRTATHITIVDDTGKVLTRKRVSSSSDGLPRSKATAGSGGPSSKRSHQHSEPRACYADTTTGSNLGAAPTTPASAPPGIWLSSSGLCGPSGSAMRSVQVRPQSRPHPDATTPCPRLPSFEFWAQRPSAKIREPWVKS
jgi:hypothetical protein